MLQCTIRLVKEVSMFKQHLGSEMQKYRLGFHNCQKKNKWGTLLEETLQSLREDYTDAPCWERSKIKTAYS